MRFTVFVFFCLPLLSACTPDAGPSEQSSAVVFEGARLIIGDDSQPIENSVFVVEGGRLSQVGVAGAVTVPDSAARVNLAGKTVMPTLIDLHVHLGYRDIEGMTDVPANFTRDNVIDHLRRSAYYGAAVVLSMGLDRGDIAFELRDNPVPGAARLLTAGPGIARPNASTGATDRRDIAYGVDTESEARAAVRELATSNVDVVKIWVDDRGGTVEKLTPELYDAIIEEADAQGLQVAAHIFNLEDAKGLLRANLHGFAHGVRDLPVDAEFMELLAALPDLYLIPNLPERGPRTDDDLRFAAETLPAEEIEVMRAAQATFEIDPAELFETQAGNLLAMHNAGVTIGFGTDSSGAGWEAHEELFDMVEAGLSPAEVIVAATSTSAEIIGLDDLGTLEVGKSADFIVLNSNPLDDIANTRDIAGVYLRGESVDRDGLRQQ
ncbi:MAG: amidohydrolase family protein [Candidatus Rariloculaceae bacterium]